MSDIKQDAGGDIAVTNNGITLVSGADEVTQRVRARLRAFYGEWFLNLRRGLPYYQDIFLKRQNPDRIASIIKLEILKTTGVLELMSYEQTINSSARTLSVSVRIKASDNEILNINEVLA